MEQFKRALLACLSGGLFLFAATSADATCSPTLYNCYCTYQVPCPVNDNKLADEVSNLVDKYRQAVTGVGTTESAQDRPATPVSKDRIEAANLAIAQQQVRNALRGPENKSPKSWTPPSIDVEFPEAALPAEKLPAIHADINSSADPSTVEKPSSILQRIGAAYVRQSLPTRDEEQRIAAIRKASMVNIAANAYARAIQKRSHIVSMAKQEDQFLDMVANSETLGQDITVNARIRNAVDGLRQEVAEMTQIYLEVASHAKLNATMDIVSPKPAIRND